jgi:hypothetical protein
MTNDKGPRNSVSKHEQTVLRALRDGWYIEEILQLFHMDPMTIHRIAKRNGLRARHAPHRPNFMRLKAIYAAAKEGGYQHAARLFRLSISTVNTHCDRFLQLERERSPAR